MILLAMATFLVLSSAVNYYLATNATLDAQQGVLLGTSRMSQELTESHRDTVLFSLPSEPQQGLIFASPRDANGNHQFDSFGRLLWQKFVCFYIGKVGEPGKEIPALLRQEVYLVDLGTEPSTAAPRPQNFGLTIEGLAQGSPGRVVGRYVSNFEARDAEQVLAEQGLQAGTFGARVLQLKLRATTTYRNAFSVEAETSVMLRN